MTKEEAMLLFSPSNGEFEDYFEDKLFEFKQYFIQKAPIKMLYQSKLTKLRRLEQGYNALGFRCESQNPCLNEVTFSDDVKETFLLWEKVRGEFKWQIMNAKSCGDVSNLINQLLEFYAKYTQLWKVDSEDGAMKVAVEPDPMDIMEAIKEFNQRGYKHFKDLTHLNEGNALLNESKRLTLLSKMNEAYG